MTTLRCVRLPEDRENLYRDLYRRAAPERKQRADRYLRREDGLRCLAAGQLLRDTVEQALGITDFTVVKEPGGKPRILGQDRFHYNLSHSGNRVIIAWGDSPIGVDVQQMRMDPGKENLARRFFTPEEQAYVFESKEARAERFYRVWTGKESYLKFLGTGLTKSLSSFSILSPEIAPMLKTRYLADGYCLSLCTNDPNCILELSDQFLSIKE